jgi:hypothetical protein
MEMLYINVGIFTILFLRIIIKKRKTEMFKKITKIGIINVTLTYLTIEIIETNIKNEIIKYSIITTIITIGYITTAIQISNKIKKQKTN